MPAFQAAWDGGTAGAEASIDGLRDAQYYLLAEYKFFY